MVSSVARAVAALCVGALFAGCGAGDDTPDPAPTGPIIAVATMQSALLKPADVGPTWVEQDALTPGQLVKLCAGEAAVAEAPLGATPVPSALVDEGDKGAQTLTQIALVYADAAAAAKGLATLRDVAAACAPSVTAPEKTGPERREPAYTETAAAAPLESRGWSGFVVNRHLQYDPAHPGVVDTAAAVLVKRNVLLVDAYAVYRLGAASTSPQFDADWRRLVGTVLNRVPD
jgi:hypothetical protein